jgi:hypothetical protein
LPLTKPKTPIWLRAALTDDAFVRDESKDYRGTDAIKAWSQSATTKYEYAIEPLEASFATDSVTLHARLTGNFPNSPVELDFKFTLANDKIARLEIT